MSIHQRLFQGALALCVLMVSLTACAADNQIITADPRDYLLQFEDLPSGVSYVIPEADVLSIPNEMALEAFGEEKGRAIITEEERIIGWRVHYQANDPAQADVQVYLASVVQHQSAKGARTAVEKYNNAALFPDGGWVVEQATFQLGDETVVESAPTQDAQGRKAISYRVEFAYRNISVDVLVFGLEDKVSVDDAKRAATTILARLKVAPLGSGPLAAPEEE